MTLHSLVRACILTIASISAAASAADALRHDLFARPLLTGPSSANRSDGTASADAAAVWSPKLTALMVAGRNSLANVQGTIVRIGEAVDGHRLLYVRENAAAFIKDDEIVVLNMPVAGAAGSVRRGGR